MGDNKLKKDSLNTFETIALSVAIMGPSASISVIVIIMAAYAGYSVPFILLISMVCVALVSVSIIKLNKYFPSSGSVYNFAEKILGKKAGFIAGWLIIFTYLMLGVSCAAIAGSDLQGALALLGLKIHWEPIVIALLALIWFLARRNAKISIRLLLVLEAFSMSVILILSIIILVKAASSTGLSITPFKPEGINLSALANATAFGFLAFSGFEGASSLGEESKNPKRAIPLAVGSAILISGVFYIIVAYAQVMGFGLTPDGIQALSGSDTPLADLSSKYLSGGISVIIMLCISISFFSSTLGCISAGARILYTMGRDGMLNKSLYKKSGAHNTPSAGINIIISVSLLILIVCFKMAAIDLGRYAATAATMALILSYLLATVCAVVYFYKNKVWKGAKLIIPVVSICILGIVFFLNVFPAPEFPTDLIQYGVFLWLVIGICIAFITDRKKAN